MQDKDSYIIAVDFDGTVVEHKYPDVGKDVPGAVDVLKKLVARGHKLILWTMRSDNTLRDAQEWYAKHGIPLYGVNTNPQQKEWTNSPKAYAQIYIDDAALGCPLDHHTELDEKGRERIKGRPFVDWDVVQWHLEQKGLI